MDIVRIRCGLGNQMFQYAFYLALKKRGRNVGLDLSFFTKYPDFVNPYELTDVFENIHFNPLPDELYQQAEDEYIKIKKDSSRLTYLNDHPEERKFWGEDYNFFGCYNPKVFETEDCTFVGVWMSYRYFEKCKQMVADQYRFGEGEPKLQKLAETLKNENVLGIHFRRANNYLEEGTSTGFHPCNIWDEGYYEKAITFAKNKLGDSAKIVVFSDDLECVKEKWSFENAIYITKDLFDDYRNWYDMFLMTVCRGLIIANSSFGWWGAWLNRRTDKIVFAPEHYCSHYGIISPITDMYPEEWIRV